MEGNLWQTWIGSKSGDDGGALSWAVEIKCRYQTGRDETEPRKIQDVANA